MLTETAPLYGLPQPMAPGCWRVVAENPGPMTYHGTNTYLVAGSDGLVVIDPGPDLAAHVAAILAARDQLAAGPICALLITHGHADHVGAAPALRAATGASTLGFAPSIAPGFTPDIAVADGDTPYGLTALHMPGHAFDHLCFAHPDGSLFSGDHVMGWSSSTISPPDGDMAAYLASLRRLLARADAQYLPGHGPVVGAPARLVSALLGHRLARERAILDRLTATPASVAALTDALYATLAANLRRAAERTVLAHVLKLQAEGRVAEVSGLWQAVSTGMAET